MSEGDQVVKESHEKRMGDKEINGEEDKTPLSLPSEPPSLPPNPSDADRSSERKRKLYEEERDRDEDPKKKKESCFRCGGIGHFYLLCPSLPGSLENPRAQVCYLCQGRGHIQSKCPNNIPPDACYRCGIVGHRARDCGSYGGYGGRVMMGGGAMRGYGREYGAPFMPPPPPYHRGYYSDLYYGPPMMSYHPMPPQMIGMEPKGKDFCFRCGQAGHFSRECTQSAGNVCYRCGQEGHIARECEICFICKKTGHFARICPERPQSPHYNY